MYLWAIIHPEARTKWDLFMLAVLTWVCFVSPFIICFGLGVSGGLSYSLGVSGDLGGWAGRKVVCGSCGV